MNQLFDDELSAPYVIMELRTVPNTVGAYNIVSVKNMMNLMNW